MKGQLRINKWVIIVLVFLLSSCDPYLKSVEITRWPDKLVYISGVDTELDFSGGILHTIMGSKDEAMDEFPTASYMESYINFNNVGIEVIVIKVPGQEMGNGNRFPIQIIDQAFIDKIVKCKTEGICE